MKQQLRERTNKGFFILTFLVSCLIFISCGVGYRVKKFNKQHNLILKKYPIASDSLGMLWYPCIRKEPKTIIKTRIVAGDTNVFVNCDSLSILKGLLDKKSQEKIDLSRVRVVPVHDTIYRDSIVTIEVFDSTAARFWENKFNAKVKECSELDSKMDFWKNFALTASGLLLLFIIALLIIKILNRARPNI